MLKGIDVEIKNLTNRKIKVLHSQNLINDGYEGIIGQEFYVMFELVNYVVIEFGNESIRLDTEEYEFIEN